MLKSQRRAGRIALAVTMLIAFFDVAVGTSGEREASGAPERPIPTYVGTPEPNRTATFHTFDIEEVFSSADGKVQFIELHETEGVEGNLGFAGNLVTTDANVFTYPSDLPDTATANRFVLIATDSFATLPGAVTPDFIIPQRFFEILGDTISILQAPTNSPVDTFTFGVTFPLPTDGVLSLNRDGTTGLNSPTNFAGETGSVTAAPPIPALAPGPLVLMALLLLAAGASITRVRRRGSRIRQ